MYGEVIVDEIGVLGGAIGQGWIGTKSFARFPIQAGPGEGYYIRLEKIRKRNWLKSKSSTCS